MSPPPTPAESCPLAWTLEGALCYRLIQSQTVDYATAAATCKAFHSAGRLAAPTDNATQAALNALNSAGTPADFWIGLDDM